jgi:hypothetical protein
VRQVTYTNGSTQGTGPSSAALAGSDLARRRVPSPAITRHGIQFVELPTPPNRRADGGRTCSLLDDAEALMRALLVLVRELELELELELVPAPPVFFLPVH